MMLFVSINQSITPYRGFHRRLFRGMLDVDCSTFLVTDHGNYWYEEPQRASPWLIKSSLNIGCVLDARLLCNTTCCKSAQVFASLRDAWRSKQLRGLGSKRAHLESKQMDWTVPLSPTNGHWLASDTKSRLA